MANYYFLAANDLVTEYHDEIEGDDVKADGGEAFSVRKGGNNRGHKKLASLERVICGIEIDIGCIITDNGTESFLAESALVEN